MARSAVILGGGLSGIAAAWSLASHGWGEVTILERGAELGGLAGSFEWDGRHYPLGYHHILHRDRTLLAFLERIGACPRVRWRRVHMLFEFDGRLWDLTRPVEFLRFPMSLVDKGRFVALMLRAFGRSDWSAWRGRTAAELVDRWAGPGVRRKIFEPLCQLKFEQPCEEVSAAWLGARLSFREGSAPLGYIPDANWTKVLCDGVTALLADVGVNVRLRTTVVNLETGSRRARAVMLETGEEIRADDFVSTVPTPSYVRLVGGGDASPGIAEIEYTKLISAICVTRQPVEPEFYWLNLEPRKHTSCGIFLLDSLNPTLGAPGERCVNFVTHIHKRRRALFDLPDDELLRRYADDFRRIFGDELEPLRSNVARVPMYSPVFDPGYRNPPVRSSSFENVWFAGNYRTYPSVASTGTALQSGLDAAEAMLAEAGLPLDRDHGR